MFTSSIFQSSLINSGGRGRKLRRRDDVEQYNHNRVFIAVFRTFEIWNCLIGLLVQIQCSKAVRPSSKPRCDNGICLWLSFYRERVCVTFSTCYMHIHSSTTKAIPPHIKYTQWDCSFSDSFWTKMQIECPKIHLPSLDSTPLLL